MSLALQAMAHARAGRRAEMQSAGDAAVATGQGSFYVEVGLSGQAEAVYHVVKGDLRAAARAGARFGYGPAAAPSRRHPVPGALALVRTLIDESGEEARTRLPACLIDVPVSREMLLAAEALALGRTGSAMEAEARFAEADRALARNEGGFRQGLVRLLVGPAAHASGWGDPIAWLRETLALFEDKDLTALAGRCRAALRDAGAPVPRRGWGDVDAVAPALAALGITSREADVLARVPASARHVRHAHVRVHL